MVRRLALKIRQLSFTQQLGVQLLLTSVLCTGLGVILLGSIRELVLSSQREIQSAEILKQSELSLRRVLDAETGQRGYLLTEDPRYLARYTTAISQIPEALDTLESLLPDEPTSQRQNALLNLYLDAKLAELANTVRLAQSGNRDAAIEIVRSNRGKNYMDNIRSSVDRINEIESVKRQERSESTQTQIRNSYIGAVVLGVAALISQLYAYQIAAREIDLRVKAEKDLRDVAARNQLMTAQLSQLTTEEVIPKLESVQVREDLLARIAEIERGLGERVNQP